MLRRMTTPNVSPPRPPSLDEVVVIDTETGGLDPDRVSLLTLALVPGDGGAPLDLVVAEDEMVITPRSLEITRLDPEALRRDGLKPAAACDQIDAWLAAHARGRRLICAGHNVAFDLAFTRRLYRLAGRSLPDFFGHRTLDTHTLLWALRAVGRLPAHIVGSDAAFAASQPLIAAMGKKIVHCGAAGAGQAAKICNNMLLGIWERRILTRRGLQ
jgi:hypothetical protein